MSVSLSYLVDLCRCPISKQIFYNPVVASDGITYEKTEILDWMKTRETSPVTREVLSRNLVINTAIKSLTLSLVENKLVDKDDIYRVIYTIADFIKQGLKENDISKITHLSFEYVEEEDIEKFFEKINNEQIVLLFKNAVEIIDGIEHVLRYAHSDIKFELVKLFDLLKFSDKKYLNDYSLIHLALEYCTQDIVEYILDSNPDLESITKDNCRPIHIALKHSTPEIINLILNKNVNINTLDNEKWSPLGYAIRFSTFEIQKRLINMGCDTTMISTKGSTIITLIIYFSSVDILRFIINNNAKILPLLSLKYDDMTTNLDLTILHQKLDMYNELLPYCKLTYSDEKIHNTVIKWIEKTKKDDKEKQDQIITFIDMNKQLIIVGKERNALLNAAIVKGHIPIVNFLLDNGAYIENKYKNGKRSIHCCLKYCLPALDRLLEKGANINSVNEKSSKDVLYYALRYQNGNRELFTSLLNRGAVLNHIAKKLKH